MDIRFDGKRALVTGAGKGIGRCIAKSLAECGAHTIALSRTAADLDSLKAEDPRIQTAVVDVANWEETRQAVQSLGDIDLLVNNAGVASPLQPAEEASPEEFDRVFAINVKAVMNISEVVAKGMIARKKGGSIVHISSVASSMALEGHLIYAATKGAVDQLMRVMALEWGPHQIRVNCVNPTVVWTEMSRPGWENEAGDRLKQRIPQRRFVELEEVANAVLYLLSDKSGMINGTALPIDGGLLIS